MWSIWQIELQKEEAILDFEMQNTRIVLQTELWQMI